MQVTSLGCASTPGQHVSGCPNPDDELAVAFEAESNSVEWTAHYTWDSLTDEMRTYCGRTTADEWLEALSEAYVYPANDWLPASEIPGKSWDTLRHNQEPVPYMNRQATSVVAASLRHFTPEPMRPHLFLDAFSIIENGERSRRYERVVPPSTTTQALLRVIDEDALHVLSPRAFETLVAATMAELGFKTVTLRRFCKDDGADIIALVSSSGRRDETVIVEVKHSTRPVGIHVLDRLNGVRDRMRADRALLVTSSYITRGARAAYVGQDSYISARTFRELVALLRDSPSWASSGHGLWSAGCDPQE